MTINNPQVKRRDLLKAGVAASAAMTVGIPLSEVARAAIQSSEGEIVWTKAYAASAVQAAVFRSASKTDALSQLRATPMHR